LEKKRRDGKAAATLRKFEWFMSFALPALGSWAITEISARDVLTVLQKVEARGTYETARKLRTAIGDVFRYAMRPFEPRTILPPRCAAHW
jgi:integrase